MPYPKLTGYLGVPDDVFRELDANGYSTDDIDEAAKDGRIYVPAKLLGECELAAKTETKGET
jgi:hypothetical protein